MLDPRPLSHVLQWPPIVEALQPILAAHTEPVYLVGGAVRDAYLRRPVHDFDFATSGDGRPVAQLIANRLAGAYYPLDPARGVGRAIVDYEGDHFTIDVAQFRGDTLAADLEARDFTMNAMAVDMAGDLQHIIDPSGGITDLNQKRLRRCGPESISSDPVRALRAIRQGVALSLAIETQTRADIRQYGSRIVNSSVERVRDEFITTLGGPRPHAALRALDALGLLSVVLPEVEAMRGVTQSAPHIYDVWEHTLRVVERLDGVLATISPARTDESAADSAYGMIVYLLDRFRRQLQEHVAVPLPNGRTVKSLLILAALLHDSGKALTRSVGPDGRIHFYQHEVAGADIALERGSALRLSNEEITRLTEIVRHHMRPMNLAASGEAEVSRRAIYRFWKATGTVGLDVCILTLADYLGMVGVTLDLRDWIHRLQIVGALLDGFYNQQETVVAPPPLVNGRDLMNALTLRAGPQIGRLLAAISEAQAAGDVSTAEDAIAFARNILTAPPDETQSDDDQGDRAPTG
jgi:tRNA nucleotidyltransferase/poly(A) polymerase